jgi:hypothetical protein
MNTKQIVYFVLCVVGTVLPYSHLIPFVRDHGLDISLLFQQLFANKISGFFGLDVIVSSVVFWVFVYSEGTKLKMRRLWIYVAANLLVGVSLGLPLFLLLRESKIGRASVATAP